MDLLAQELCVQVRAYSNVQLVNLKNCVQLS